MQLLRFVDCTLCHEKKTKIKIAYSHMRAVALTFEPCIPASPGSPLKPTFPGKPFSPFSEDCSPFGPFFPLAPWINNNTNIIFTKA